MKLSSMIGIGFLVLMLLCLMGSCGTYNGLVNGDEAVNKQYAQVDTVLQRRSDLIPNLVQTCKGYMKHEEKVFTGIAEARAKVGQMNVDVRNATPEQIDQMVAAQNQMTGALSRLLVTVENYPQLKADETMKGLMHELAGTENRIAVERKRYNDIVGDQNAKIRRFPSNIIAGMGNFQKRAYFEAPEESKQPVKVNFTDE